MAGKLKTVITSVVSFFSRKKKAKETSIPPIAVKHYTFLLKISDEKRNINIIARDKSEAERKIRTLYPNCEGDFLWEYTRRTADDMKT